MDSKLTEVSEMFDRFKATITRRDYDTCTQLLSQLKVMLTGFRSLPPLFEATPDAIHELTLAKDIYEHAVLLSVKVEDQDAFERDFFQLKPYYTDARSHLPPSPNEYMILGLNLLRLLVQNRIAEFHTELELLSSNALENPCIKHAVELEQSFMEWAYNCVLSAKQNVPHETYGYFMDLLAKTLRLSISSQFGFRISTLMSQISVLVSPMPDWSELNYDLLVEIAKRIKLYEDFVAFRWVCSSWQLAASVKNFSYKSDQMPLLMLPSEDGSDQRGFFNLSKRTIHRVCLPEANGKKCLSSKGWLFIVTRDLRVSLVHPFSRVQIELPSVKTLKNWQENLADTGHICLFQKFVLSSSINVGEDNRIRDDYTIIVTYGSPRKIAYYKPGQKTWITLTTTPPDCSYDIVYYKNKYYSIGSGIYRGIMECDLNNSKQTVVAPMPSAFVDPLGLLYLVESNGGLLFVHRYGVFQEGPISFRVFEVDLTTNTWTQVKNIGNRALFLGHNSSFSIEVLDNSVCKPNCIYFTDDCIEFYLCSRRRGGGQNMGIYNIGDGSIIQHFERSRVRSRLAPAMWVEQTFI